MIFVGLGVQRVQARPIFWATTPTPEPPQVTQPLESTAAHPLSPTPTPARIPEKLLLKISRPKHVSKPYPNSTLKSTTAAAILSAIIPGSGQIYTNQPFKALGFAAVFGVTFWQMLENFRLVADPHEQGGVIAINQDAGSLFGLAAVAAYGFGIEDAMGDAANYNRHISEFQPDNPQGAQCLSAVCPGLGQIYTNHPFKGVVVAGIFGTTLWQTILNRHQTMGYITGAVCLLDYVFGIEDAYFDAISYNRQSQVHVSWKSNSSSSTLASLSYSF